MSFESSQHNSEDNQSKATVEEILNLELDYLMEYTPAPVDVDGLELDDTTRAHAEGLVQSRLGMIGLRESDEFFDPEHGSYEEE